MFGVWIGNPDYVFGIFLLYIVFGRLCGIHACVLSLCASYLNFWSFFFRILGYSFFWYYGCIFGILPFSNGLKENVKRF